MKIRIIKKGNRNQLVCVRSNGRVTLADLGPSLPFHDLAHYVVESERSAPGEMSGVTT